MLHFASPAPATEQACPPASHAIFMDDPADIRVRAAQLVADGRQEQARALIEQAMEHHPANEHLLTMHALLHEMRQNWPEADRSLQQLLSIQGVRAPADAWAHWIRVLRCQGQLERAWDATLQALQLHPDDLLLNSEHQTLQSMAQAGAFALPRLEDRPPRTRRHRG